MTPRLSRRRFLRLCVGAAGVAVAAEGQPRQIPSLEGAVGVTTSSLFRQMREGASDRFIDLYDLPRVLHEELGIRVIDINTGTLGSHEPRHLDRLRRAAEAAGTVITNLKVNATMLRVKVLDLPFDHADPAIRRAALDEYKPWILAASRLGAHWLRPYPSPEKPDFSILVDSYRELADFGAAHGVTLVVENNTWLQSDPHAIPSLVQALDGRIAAAPDTGSWEASIRYEALERAFPLAVTCDFKVGRLGPAGEHPSYDLRRCFEIGWRAGFRGPWCIEHGNANSATLFRELAWIKGRLESWMREMG